MSSEKSAPSKIALRFFKWFCDPDLHKYLEGDLLELFEKNKEEKGLAKAKQFLMLDILKLFRPSMIKSSSGGQKLNYYGMFKHHLKIGWRAILRNKVDSIINIIGLSTGAAVCMVILMLYNYETTFDAHHENTDRTYRVVQHTQRPDQELYWNTTAYPLAAALRNDFPDFDQVTQVAGPMKRLFKLESETNSLVRFEEEHVLFADAHYPDVFDLEWIVGDKNSALEVPNGVVITEMIAKKCFSNNYRSSNVIGQIMLLNNKEALTITGVVKNPPPTTTLKFNMLISYEFFKKHNPYYSSNWSGNYRGTTFVVLKDQKSELEIESKINKWKGNYLNEDDNKQISYWLQPIKEIHTETMYGSAPMSYQIDKNTLDISIMVAFFILLIAIVNFINLVTARATLRSKEVGVRKTIGSSKSNLVFQFLLENSLVVLISLGVALLLTYQMVLVLNESLSIINMKLGFQLNEIMLILAICFMLIIISSIYPAFVLSSFKPIDALNYKDASKGRKGFFFRKGLTFLQFTLVQVFVIAALIVGIQINYFNSKSPGFSSDQVVMIPVPSHDKIEVIRNQLLESGNMNGLTFASGPPMSINNFSLGTNCWLPHQEKLDAFNAEMKIVDPGYLQLFDLELIAGRNFTNNKPQFDEFIINEKLAESFGWNPQEAIGQTIRINEGEAKVIGVLKDFHNHSFQYEVTPVVMMNWSAWQWQASIKIASYESLIQIEEIWKSQFPESIFSYTFLDDAIAKEYVLEHLIFNGFKLLSVLVIIIGCLGLFGLMSFIILQKTKEIGIRKVLGASVSQIIKTLSKEFSIIILIGFIVATPIVYYFMNMWLNDFTYRVDLSPWIFAKGGMITFLLGIGLTTIKSLKAARSNPIESLNYE